MAIIKIFYIYLTSLDHIHIVLVMFYIEKRQWRAAALAVRARSCLE